MLIVVLAAVSGAVMLLWNLLIPAIFGLTAINFWQALGLFVLARILFGGFGFSKRAMMMRAGDNPIHQKWRKMSMEQRKEFLERRRKFGCRDHFGRRGFGGMDEFDEPAKDNE